MEYVCAACSSHDKGEVYALVCSGTMALEGMEVAELLLYLAGIISTLAAAYMATSYLQLKSKSKST